MVLALGLVLVAAVMDPARHPARGLGLAPGQSSPALAPVDVLDLATAKEETATL